MLCFLLPCSRYLIVDKFYETQVFISWSNKIICEIELYIIICLFSFLATVGVVQKVCVLIILPKAFFDDNKLRGLN